MFKAIVRYIKAVGYMVTGRMNKARETLDRNPSVIAAKYDSIITKESNRIEQGKSAVSKILANHEKKKTSHAALLKEIEKFVLAKKGAQIKAQKLASSFASLEEAQKNQEFQHVQSQFKDISSTLEEKEKRAIELEKDIIEYDERLIQHKSQIEESLRTLRKIKEEKNETIADVTLSQQEKEANDLLSGLNTNSHAEELSSMRDMRDNVKAEAKLSREVSGIDDKAAEDELIALAESEESNNEFTQGLVFAGTQDDLEMKEDVNPASAQKTMLPEN